MKRKGDTKSLRASAYTLMRRYGWSIEDFAEYVQGPTFKTLRKKADKAIARRKEFEERMKPYRIHSPEPLQAGPVWLEYSLIFAGISEVLEGEVIIGPRGGRKVRFSEPWFNGKGATEYIKPPSYRSYENCWIVSSHRIFTSKAAADEYLNTDAKRFGCFVGDNLPSEVKELRRLAQDNHPDRNPEGDISLYQTATAKIKMLRRATVITRLDTSTNS